MSIIYDKRSPYWKMDNFEFNKLFVKSQLNYARNLYRASGYIYTWKDYIPFLVSNGTRMLKTSAGY